MSITRSVQSAKGNWLSGSPQTVALTGVTVGNLLTLAIGTATASTITVTDTDGGTWAIAKAKAEPSAAARVDLWYCLSAPATTTHIVMTPSALAGCDWAVLESHTSAGTWELGDTDEGSTAFGTTATTPSLTVTAAVDNLIACGATTTSSSANGVAGTDFTMDQQGHVTLWVALESVVVTSDHAASMDFDAAVSAGLAAAVFTPAAPAAPTLSSALATTDGHIALTFSEDVVVSGGGSGGVTVTGTTTGAIAAGSVSTSGAVATYVLTPAPVEGETLTVSYVQPADGIQASDDGADVESFTDEAVTNQVINPPTGLTVTQTTPTFQLTFSEGGTAATSIEIEWDTVSTFDNDPQSASVDDDAGTYELPELTPGTYYFRVRGVNTNGNGQLSETVSDSSPEAPAVEAPPERLTWRRRRARRHQTLYRHEPANEATVDHPRLTDINIWNYCRMSGSEKPDEVRFMAWAPGESAPQTLNPVVLITMPTENWWAARLGIYDFEEAYLWGVRRFFCWLPAGQTPTSMMSLDGTATAYASTPHASDLNITADFQIEMSISPADWTPATARVLAAKYSNLQESWRLTLNTDGKLALEIGSGLETITSTAGLGALTAGALARIKVTLDVDNGSDEYVAKFWKWNTVTEVYDQIGATVQAASALVIPATTAVLTVGQDGDETSDAAFTGSIFWMILRNGIDGPIIAEPRFNLQYFGRPTFTDAQSRLWTLQGAAEHIADPTWAGIAYAGYSLDAFIQAQRDGLTWLADDFLDAWRAWLWRHSDAHVMFYVGNEFGGLEGLLPQEFQDLADASVAPYLALFNEFGSRVSLAIDSSDLSSATSQGWLFRNRLVGLGVSVSCEALATTDKAHWAAGPQVCTETWWNQRASNGSVADADLGYPVKVITTDSMTVDQFRTRFEERMDDGREIQWVPLNLAALWQNGVSWEELTRYP